MEIFDFGVGFPAIDEGNVFFVNCLKADCGARGMKFIFIDAKSLDNLTGEIKNGNFKLKFYLDMASETFDPKDAYLKFNYVLKDSGTRIVADPDDVKVAADKAVTHFNLVRAGIPVPFTILIRGGEPNRQLTGEETEKLGHPFIIKPALGYGQRGVKIATQGTMFEDIAEARKVKMGDNFLAQEFIEPKEINRTPAWFRLYHTFGEIIPCWWNPNAHTYRQVTRREVDEHELLPMIHIAAEIARITRIDWFSCEVAINKKNNEFIAIDYMNDQCWINPQSKFNEGVPDCVIIRIAERIVEKAWDYINGRFTLTNQAMQIFLAI